MRVLLFLICLIFAFILFLFFITGKNVSGAALSSPLYSSMFFFLIWLYFIFVFSRYSFNSPSKEQEWPLKDVSYYKWIIKEKFLEYSHFVSYIFFYLWVYLLSLVFPWLHFGYFIFFANIFVFLFYYLFQKNDFSSDFLRINQIIFSCIYSISYILILFGQENFFQFIDFINSFLIISSFVLSLHLSKNLKGDAFFIGNFLLYSYLCILFYTSYILKDKYLFLSWVNVWLGSAMICLANAKLTHLISSKLIRGIWVLLTYIGSFVAALSIIYAGQSLLVSLILILSICLNFTFHLKYQNYISFAVSILSFSLLLFTPSFGNIDGVYNFVFILFFSYFLLFSTYFFQKKYTHDYVFVHGMSYIYNIWWISFFFIYYSPSLRQITLLMFVEFFYFFLSYYKLSKQQNTSLK
jgi:hypothetical protein